jgi:hypothetical protein
MVEIPTGLAINTPTEADRTIPATFRKIMATFFGQTTPGAPVPGIIQGPTNDDGYTPLQVHGDPSGMNYLVPAGYAVTTRTGEGAYIVGTSDDLTVPTSPADGSHDRIDLIYIVQPDPELTDTGHARIDVAVGTPASNPTEPTGSLPSGALVLRKKLVAAGATNTNDGAAFYGEPATTGVSVSWANISSLPASFPPSAHTHTATQITDPQNLNVGKINGSKISVTQTQPTSPAVGDVWISW